MEMIVMPKEEFQNLLATTLEKVLKNNQKEPIVPQKKNEGGVNFALEILREKAGLESLATLYKWSHEGRIPCEKRGKKLWFHRDELEAWIEEGMPHVGQIKAANRLSKLNR